jgi:hypothetical protein
MVDNLLGVFSLQPIRCDTCGNRFYRLNGGVTYLIPLALFAVLVISALGGYAYWNVHTRQDTVVPASQADTPSKPTVRDVLP